MAPPATPPNTLTVSQLAGRVRRSLEGEFDRIWVRGELTNFRAYPSGHWYFTLKDERAQLKAAMFGRDNRQVRFRPQDGDEVLVEGRVDLYERRGDLQIVASWMEPLGTGRLQRRFEQLKARLQAEGLFEDSRKKRLPRVPRRIGIVTSPKAAALQDMLRVLQSRDPGLSITIAAARVQGDGAGGTIAAAIDLLNRLTDVEVILCGRGGGSLEDLWAFNEEVVARAIAASRIPIVSAVGHEVDFTIADLVADVRAATPTAAAELVVLPRAELDAAIAGLRQRLASAVQRDLGRRRARTDELRTRLPTPSRRLEAAHQRVDEARERLGRAATIALGRRHDRLASVRRALDMLGPLASLRRGYAIVLSDGGDGPVLRDAADASPGDRVRVRLHRGVLRCTVDEARVGEFDLRGREGNLP
jgi:exodeoxyribonuclease VII large subunit